MSQQQLMELFAPFLPHFGAVEQVSLWAFVGQVEVRAAVKDVELEC